MLETFVWPQIMVNWYHIRMGCVCSCSKCTTAAENNMNLENVPILNRFENVSCIEPDQLYIGLNQRKGKFWKCSKLCFKLKLFIRKDEKPRVKIPICIYFEKQNKIKKKQKASNKRELKWWEPERNASRRLQGRNW